MEKLALKLKSEVIKRLGSNEQVLDEPYMVAGEKSYTRRDILNEVENETDFGVQILTNMIMLAIDLTARGKR